MGFPGSLPRPARIRTGRRGGGHRAARRDPPRRGWSASIPAASAATDRYDNMPVSSAPHTVGQASSDMARGSGAIVVALPVYNGAGHVEAAIRSILGQSEREFSLVISDNCSEDDTGAICRRLAAEDARITYVRQPANIGALQNFEWLLRNTQGEYFAWAAHDHRYQPTFLAECLAVLEARTHAVGCITGMEFLVEANGARWVGTVDQGMSSPRVADRIRASMRGASNVCIYGLFRRPALVAAVGPEFLPIIAGADWLFAFRVALAGRFEVIDGQLVLALLLGFEETLGADGRMHWTKEHGRDARLYDRNHGRRYRHMVSDAGSAALGMAEKCHVLALVLVRWLRFLREWRAAPIDNRMRAMVKSGRYAAAVPLFLAYAALKPIAALREAAESILRRVRRAGPRT